MRKPLPTGLDIELRGGLSEATTPHAGAELLIDLGRRSGVMAAAEKYLPQKKSPKGLGHGQMVESMVLLSALGGDCIDDFQGLRQDHGLAALLGMLNSCAAGVGVVNIDNGFGAGVFAARVARRAAR